MRILNVEDDPAAAKTVAAILEEIAESCDWAGSGVEAVELAGRNDYDLILLDLLLPDIDGYEVLRRLRGGGDATPCLILTGLLDPDMEFDARAVGADGFLFKPAGKSELFDAIGDVMQKASAGRAAPPPPAEPPPPPPPTGDERRRLNRLAADKAATIEYDGGIACRIGDLTLAGAAIRLDAADTTLPRSFNLLLAGGDSHLCRISWRDGEWLGVKFLDAGRE